MSVQPHYRPRPLIVSVGLRSDDSTHTLRCSGCGDYVVTPFGPVIQAFLRHHARGICCADSLR